jgi:hypothetical protein
MSMSASLFLTARDQIAVQLSAQGVHVVEHVVVIALALLEQSGPDIRCWVDFFQQSHALTESLQLLVYPPELKTQVDLLMSNIT